MVRPVEQDKDPEPVVGPAELLRKALAWMMLPGLAVETALSAVLFREWLSQHISFVLPTVGGITEPVYLCQLALWPVALIAVVFGHRRQGEIAAAAAAVLVGLGVGLSHGHVGSVGIVLLDAAVALAVLATPESLSAWYSSGPTVAMWTAMGFVALVCLAVTRSSARLQIHDLRRLLLKLRSARNWGY